ncbi:hypothetical protein ACFLWA_12200 [Chloroflexota bacterium]
MRSRALTAALILAAVLLAGILLFQREAEPARAQGVLTQTAPQLVSYQGRLTDDLGEPVNGTKDMAFSVYVTETATAALWSESHSAVPVEEGDFSVLLGEVTPLPEGLFSEAERWLEVVVDGVTLSPRQQFTSAPYALNADKLDGYDADDLMGSGGGPPAGAVVWFPLGASPAGYTPLAGAWGQDVGPWEPRANGPQGLGWNGRCDIWTGSEVICTKGHWGQPFRGSRYDPATDTWTPIPPPPPELSYGSMAAVWSGSELLVWAGDPPSGARYDPATDTWTPMSTTNAPSPRDSHKAVWTGSEMIIWGGYQQVDPWGCTSTGGRYDPATDTWTPIDSAAAITGRCDHFLLWTGSTMIVFGGSSGQDPQEFVGAVYDPATDVWQPMASDNGIAYVWYGAWTGSEMVVSYQNYLHFYDPESDSWRSEVMLSSAHYGAYSPENSIVTAGDLIVAQGGLYDLSQGRTVALPPAIYWTDAVWTGDTFLLFDHRSDDGELTTVSHTFDIIFPYVKE